VTTKTAPHLNIGAQLDKLGTAVVREGQKAEHHDADAQVIG
jgi:hypothetical protein